MKTPFLFSLFIFLFSLVSCMKDKPENFPESLVWNPELAVPIGIDSFGMNEESGFDITLLEPDTLSGLPLWVNKREIILERSLEFDLSSVDTYLDSVNQLLFRLNIYNGFPEEALAQAYFLNASNEAIDSIFSDGALPVPAGTPLDGGANINPSYIRKDAIFSKERISALEEATELLLRTVLSNEEIDSLLIPYYPGYRIDIEIGMMADLSLEF